MTTSEPGRAARPPIALPETFIGLGLLAFAGLVLWQSFAIPVSPMYSKVGPTVFPVITSMGLCLFAIVLLVMAFRGGWQPDDEKSVPLDWKALGFVFAGLVANVALIGPLGFSAASTVLFVLVSYGFGGRQPIRDALIGLAISLAAYFGFAKALGVNIGAGLLENLLGG
jgi:putative tricarboxylic transport membrane protein